MLNFRKIKQDFSQNIIKDGKKLEEAGAISQVSPLHFDGKTLKLGFQARGAYDNLYNGELELDVQASEIIYSDCDCPKKYDCEHLAAFFFYLEKNIDEVIASFAQSEEVTPAPLEDELDPEEKESCRKLEKTLKEAQEKANKKKSKQLEKEVLEEYVQCAEILQRNPFFSPKDEKSIDTAQLYILLSAPEVNEDGTLIEDVELQLGLRLPHRSKPIYIPDIKEFIESVEYGDKLFLAGKEYRFSYESFDELTQHVLKEMVPYITFKEVIKERDLRLGVIPREVLGTALNLSFLSATSDVKKLRLLSMLSETADTYPELPLFYIDGFESPLKFSLEAVNFEVDLECMEIPSSKLMLNSKILCEKEGVPLNEVLILNSRDPSIIKEGIYYRFVEGVTRSHIKQLSSLFDLMVPEPLFGTFIEHALPELMRFASVKNRQVLSKYVTLPYASPLSARCKVYYLNSKLEAELFFLYDGKEIPAMLDHLKGKHLESFVHEGEVHSRDLWAEQKITRSLFQDFVYDKKSGTFAAKNERQVVEFMTEVIPRFREVVEFDCPENLLDQFVYDETKFSLKLCKSKETGVYEVDLKVKGSLNGIKLDKIWDCILSERSYVETGKKAKQAVKAKQEGGVALASKTSKILVLDLKKLSPVIRFLDDLGIQVLESHTLKRPIWTLTHVDEEALKELDMSVKIDKGLKEIQKQLLGQLENKPGPIPKKIGSILRPYQIDGIHWLERLRQMHLGGVLADDMGLGKTLQAIVAITQHKEKSETPSLVVCPTSLLYNWLEEFNKFNPKLKAQVIDGNPTQRKKKLESLKKVDVIITSYTLLQKDVETYKKISFGYMILDEAQHIKNRQTQNAQSVKKVSALHKLVMTGTPVENALEEMWSLFDFLMPGLMSSYERFSEKYIKVQTPSGQSVEVKQTQNPLMGLKRKITPFILRRMKEEVLDDLPPVSEIVYHCHLSPAQKELYDSYANSAREELSALVEKEGFKKVQIHILATLTRLKQICCHPAIFAKDEAEINDSAKYDMFLEVVDNLIEGGHKAVVFSQYTRMLSIMRDDLQRRGIKVSYLDGSSKDRMEIVKEFNEDASIPIFLVSLRAGGTGLNLTGADTVIHYDMWWNPAVENQATDRVHRMGQTRKVSSYKLVTLGTIEEKIIELQNRKKGLVKKLITSDDEAISKLTWEEVLQLLQT